MTASQVYECSELPFLKSEWGFPYREWNQTRPFTLITGQLYKCEDFRLLQSGCYTIQLQGSLLYADSHPIIHEIIPILYKWLLAKYPSIKTYAFSKVSVKLWNYRVPPPLREASIFRPKMPDIMPLLNLKKIIPFHSGGRGRGGLVFLTSFSYICH